MSDITVNNFKAFYEQIRPYLGAAHSGFTPIGTVISVMGTTAPLNYLACDGTVYNISDYPELAAYFNQQFGSSNFFGGNGTTTFAVPDLRGEFLRGTGTNSHANQGSGAAVGVHQDGTEFPYVYTYRGDNDYITVGFRPPDTDNTQINIKKADSIVGHSSVSWSNCIADDHASKTGSYASIVTSCPTNTSLMFVIASKNIFMDAGSNYSTEEQVVGTWIDGKPIYQKTIHPSLANNSYVDISSLDCEYLDVFNVKYKHKLNSSGCIPFFLGSNSCGFESEYSNGSITKIITNNSNSYITDATYDAYVTLQYTKTTD